MTDNRARVLVVEDDDDTRTFLVDLFESDGYEVRVAADPEGAHAALREFEPDLVILDVMLPRENGFSIYRRAKVVRPGLPAIFITAKPTDLPRLYARELGASDFFRKPFEGEALLASARAAIAPERRAA